ncbi:uncharacterized protein LOC131001850 isoform X2 [Salvia miltiorrhiza]|uniref:uncharacterized protein LOC131001850 isoform X2 n=1 Tax=Salvia miltiorrhiza TaxID=226208 RepID=UPI0025ABCF03|nr:uncharacterized protein LOC131001850 isoform X2 [Salvia miltiorrhiza]
MGGSRSSCSSSGEEDGDADWMAAINSVTSPATHTSNGATHRDQHEKHKPQNLKHYQIKAGRLLEDILDKTIEMVSEEALIVEEDPAAEDAGVRLFRNAPHGIVFDQRELHGPTKKPKIVPREELHEKSKKFRKQLQSVAVDGVDIIAVASRECQKSLAKREARESAAKTAAKQEEERVAELKRIRGERWLPCIAKEMRVNAQCRR